MSRPKIGELWKIDHCFAAVIQGIGCGSDGNWMCTLKVVKTNHCCKDLNQILTRTWNMISINWTRTCLLKEGIGVGYES